MSSNTKASQRGKRLLWLHRILYILSVPLIAIGLLFGWYYIRYSPNAPLKLAPMVMTLPFAPENEATSMRALGEVEDVHPFGHPGIDFQWAESVPIRAAFDGTVTSIKESQDMGQPVLYLTLAAQGYKSVYKEMDSVVSSISEGAEVTRGQELGTPHCVNEPDGRTHCQIHWEFMYGSIVPMIAGHVDRLCPLAYYDADALQRIETIWEGVKENHADLPGFPDICNPPY